MVRRSALLQYIVFVCCVLLVLAALDPALAQFGLNRAPAPEVGGFAGWILAEQAKFYLQLSSLIRAAKADGSAAYTLLGISFVYGVFHAAGPGHGKAVISSYMIANDETWRRGVILSFASAILQAFTAIAIVGIAAVLLGATAKMMGDTVRVIEEVSYALIIVIGLRLLWVKGRALLHLLRPQKHHQAQHDHAHEHHRHGHDHAHDHGHAHDRGGGLHAHDRGAHVRARDRGGAHGRGRDAPHAAAAAGARRPCPSPITGADQ